MKQPLFILSTMRSFTSLISTMLGQHPEMYGLPEVNLFVSDDLQGVMSYYLPKRPHGLDGLVRTIAEVEWGGQTAQTLQQAIQWLGLHRHDSTIKIFYYLAQSLSPKIVVEKSPVTVKSMQHLNRLADTFPQARFLHLVRHPMACCDSIYRFHQWLDERKESHMAEWIQPESVWLKTNQNIIRFLKQFPHQQWMQVQGERILSKPTDYLPQICQWLHLRDDVEAIEAMLHPENSPYASIGPEPCCYGNDPHFLHNPYYRSRNLPVHSLQDAVPWVEGDKQYLSQATLKLARELGYH